MAWTDAHAIFNVLNFLLFVVVVAKFAGPAVASAVEAHRARVEEGLTEAARLRAEAEITLTETRARLANLEHEVAQVVAEGKATAESKAADMLAAAHDEVERLKLSASADIERERQRAVQEIRALVMRQAFERATELLRRDMNAERQQELVAGLVQKVGDGSLALK